MLYRCDTLLKNIKFETYEHFIDTQESYIKELNDPMIKEFRYIDKESNSKSQIIYSRCTFGIFAKDRDSLIEMQSFMIGP